MKKLLLIMIFLATTGAMAGDAFKWEKESRNAVPHPRVKVPKAEALVIRANSKLLDRAFNMYVQANVFRGAERVSGGGALLVGRRAAWLEGMVKIGRCRK